MKLQHHLGGLEGLDGAPIDFERRVFVEDWEQRIFGIHVAMMGLSSSLRDALPEYDIDAVPSELHSTWTWADLRKGAEAMSPFEYFRLRYYEKWLGGITGYFVEQGYITAEELEAAHGRPLASKLPEPEQAQIDAQVERYLREGDDPRRGPATPRYTVGDTVLVADPPASDHTRLPGYLRNRTGTIARVFEGSYAYFCSTGADGLGEPVPVYAVRFDPAELWGETTESGAGPLFAELYETYLEPTA